MERLLRSVSRQLEAVPRWVIPAVAAATAIGAGIVAVTVLGLGSVLAGAGRLTPAGPGGPVAAGGPAQPGGTSASASAAGQPSQSPSGAGSADQAGSVPASAFSAIVLPDLMIVSPQGLTGPQAAAVRAISGVRGVLVLDGGQINAAGRPVSVAGVDPAQFRSWVPLAAATNQVLWNNLAAGGFLATTSVASSLGLQPGQGYQLYGASTATVPFGGSAAFGVGGIDLLVNPATSQRLGLAHQVAALVSAPGLSLATLTARVASVLGSGDRLVALRSSQSPASSVPAGPITNYLQLFQASAAKYCPSMSWTVLAAIGQIESADGRNNGPSSAGALGPMQFMPATWSYWGITGFGPAGTPDIMNPLDAVPSAARMLCADGASAGTQAGLRQAVFAYNHATWYVDEVLALAAQYAASYG